MKYWPPTPTAAATAANSHLVGWISVVWVKAELQRESEDKEVFRLRYSPPRLQSENMRSSTHRWVFRLRCGRVATCQLREQPMHDSLSSCDSAPGDLQFALGGVQASALAFQAAGTVCFNRTLKVATIFWRLRLRAPNALSEHRRFSQANVACRVCLESSRCAVRAAKATRRRCPGSQPSQVHSGV